MEWLVEVALEHPWRFASVCLVIVAGVGGALWWQAVWENPQHVFQDMLANNLAATSVTRQVSVSDSSQSIDQTIRLQMGGNDATDWLVSATQNGSGVTTESIATPSAGYLRYLRASDQSGKAAAAYAPYLNLWAKSDGKTDADLDQLFDETVLDVTNVPAPPIADLPVAKRENLLQFISDNKVFTPDYSNVKAETVAGRSVDTFQVSVQLATYVQLMQTFAHDLGMQRLDQLDANQYIGAAPITVSMSVDRLSHQLVRVAYAAGNFSQTYSEWGLQPDITLPKAVLTTTQLQQDLERATK